MLLFCSISLYIPWKQSPIRTQSCGPLKIASRCIKYHLVARALSMVQESIHLLHEFGQMLLIAPYSARPPKKHGQECTSHMPCWRGQPVGWFISVRPHRRFWSDHPGWQQMWIGKKYCRTSRANGYIDKSLQEHTFRQESSEGRWLLLHLLGVVNSLLVTRFISFYYVLSCSIVILLNAWHWPCSTLQQILCAWLLQVALTHELENRLVILLCDPQLGCKQPFCAFTSDLWGC